MTAKAPQPEPAWWTFDLLPDAVVVVGADGAIRYVNGVAERVLGWQASSLVGHPLTTIQPSRYHDAHRRAFARFIETGTGRLLGRPIRLFALRRDGTEVPIELTLAATPVVGGEIQVIGTLREDTPRHDLERQLSDERHRLAEEREARDMAEQAQRRLRFLASATAIVNASLDLPLTLQQIAETAVPELADWCIVDLLAKDGTIDRVAVHHADPDKVAAARRFRSSHPPDPDSPVGAPHVMRTGEPEIVPYVTADFIRDAPVDRTSRTFWSRWAFAHTPSCHCRLTARS